MSNQGKENAVTQTSIAGRDSKQVAGSNNESNHNLFIGIFFLVVLALGGLTWAWNIGLNQSKQTPSTEKSSQTR